MDPRTVQKPYTNRRVAQLKRTQRYFQGQKDERKWMREHGIDPNKVQRVIVPKKGVTRGEAGLKPLKPKKYGFWSGPEPWESAKPKRTYGFGTTPKVRRKREPWE